MWIVSLIISFIYFGRVYRLKVAFNCWNMFLLFYLLIKILPFLHKLSAEIMLLLVLNRIFISTYEFSLTFMLAHAVNIPTSRTWLDRQILFIFISSILIWDLLWNNLFGLVRISTCHTFRNMLLLVYFFTLFVAWFSAQDIPLFGFYLCIILKSAHGFRLIFPWVSCDLILGLIEI